MNPSRSQNAGFTLIELMVALALSLFLMGGAILMYLSVQRTYGDAEQLSRMQENVRFASDYLVRDIRNAGFRDEFSLSLGQSALIRAQVAALSEDGSRLTVRYAGRGHCQTPFDEYAVVENTYFFDADSGELHCQGRTVPPDSSDPTDSIALVSGLSGLAFRMRMADGSETSSNTTCSDDPGQPLGDRCLGVRIGLEFDGLRPLEGGSGTDERFVELFASLRNPAIGHIYSNLD